MIKLVVVALILILIMVVFVFILFKNIIRRMDENAKKYFVNKLQDYDYILDEKQETLNNLKSQINEMKIKTEHYQKIEKDNVQLEETFTQKNNDLNTQEEIKYNLNVPEYRETQFFNNYKEIKKLFSVNNEKIIKDFIKEHRNEKEEKKYKELQKIRKKFDNDTIYQILTLSSIQQINLLDEVLTATDKKVINFESWKADRNFNIRKFIQKIDKDMEEIDPSILIYANGNEHKYELIDDNITVEQYNNMSEGIIIKYRNKVYDYSI